VAGAATAVFTAFFTEAGAKAYLKDLPNAELHLLDTGHFALEEDGPLIATFIREFLADRN
jgi:pimeloyl-ACP methyl ester carboxylesterase